MQSRPPAADRTAALLSRSARGDRVASDELLELVYTDLRRSAEGFMRREAVGHTLQPTALVNEAYLRLLQRREPGEDRSHFLRLAAATMRRVLVDHARRSKAAKRGGGGQGVTLDSRVLAGDEGGVDVLALEDALEQLGTLDPRGAQVVELRFYGGLTEPEVARELGVSERTVRNDWAHARVWLHRAMFPDPG